MLEYRVSRPNNTSRDGECLKSYDGPFEFRFLSGFGMHCRQQVWDPTYEIMT